MNADMSVVWLASFIYIYISVMYTPLTGFM